MSFPRLSHYMKAEHDKFITVVSEEIEEAPQMVTIINREHIVLAKTWD